MSITPCKDHLNNQYHSLNQMLEVYHISRQTYQDRIDKGWSLEQALMTPTKKPTIDHNGIAWYSQKEMCEYYHVSFLTFRGRLLRGKSMEEALRPVTDPTKIKRNIRDYLGSHFKSSRDVCAYWGISLSVYQRYSADKGTNVYISADDIVNMLFTTMKRKTINGYKIKNKIDSFYLVEHQGKEYIMNAETLIDKTYGGRIL